MPVTAKLSRTFYERLGDDVVNELVDWFNAVDATYRADLDRLNELNFTRFDAKVEQRFAEADAKVERRFVELEVKIEQQLAELRVEMGQRFAEFDVKLEQRTVSVVRWLFAFWIGTLVPLAGLMVVLSRI